MAYKLENEKNFHVNDNVSITCHYQNTSYGFRHLATLYINGFKQDQTSKAYYNRTWECFTYESVLNKLADRQNKELEQTIKNFVIDYQKIDEQEINKKFGMIANIASLGNIFADNQKDKNSWKERMLKAGLINKENEGLIMPDNWNELSEDEKEIRLNNVINEMK